MKKIISLALAFLMIAATLVITVNAKDPYGTLVKVPYTTKAPSMTEAPPDASWGDLLIHVDKNSPNTALCSYANIRGESPLTVKEDTYLDVYGKWTDSTFYVCFVSGDTSPLGSPVAWVGDGIQINMNLGSWWTSMYSADYGEWSDKAWKTYSYLITTDFDDVSCWYDGMFWECDEEPILYWDDAGGKMVVKMAVPFKVLGAGKNGVKDGDFISFSLIRLISEAGETAAVGTGWLEWGDMYNKAKAAPGGDEATDARTQTKATTSPNSFILTGKNGGTPTTPDTPVTPITPTEQPSSWAKAEVDKAIAAGLVPAELQANYTKGISRANLSKILSALLDKVYGKAPTKNDAKFKDTTDADVLKAANLGIINGYDAGNGEYNFKPNNTLKRSEMSAIVNRVAKLCGKTTTGYDKEVKFADTANHWCKTELGWPVHVGIVKGTSDTTFSPENTLTTEQTIMMIYRAYEALK